MCEARSLYRAYLPTCAGELVHVRVGGSGPAVLLLPDVPGSGAGLARLGQELIERGHAVAIPDLAGAGGTTVNWVGGLADQARLAATVIVGMGWSNAAVVGDGAGAAIAARLAIERPDLIAGPLRLLSAPYSGSMHIPEWNTVIDNSGAHLVRLWHEVRDTFLFSPFWHRSGATRRARAMPAVEVLHAIFMDTLPFTPAYRHLADAARREWPALIASVHEEPVLCGGPDYARGVLDGLGVGEPASCADATSMRRSPGPVRQMNYTYVDVPYGQVHVRSCRPSEPGSTSPLPLLLLHPNPGSAERIEGLVGQVGTERWAIAPDLPGHGRSDDLPAGDADGATLEAYVPTLLDVMDDLGVDRFDVYGTHTGAGLAAELAIRAPDRVRGIVFDGMPLFDDNPSLVSSVLNEYFVDISPDRHGSHLVRAWGMLHDMALWWPWFRQDPESSRAGGPAPATTIHQSVSDFLRSASSYAVAYRAAWSWKGSSRLPLVTQQSFVGTPPNDSLQNMTGKALSLLPNARMTEFSAIHERRGQEVLALLRAVRD